MGKRSNLINEQELISACIRGEQHAQHQLFERYAAKMLAICSRYCPNKDDAKDALHEGYIKVFHQITRFKGNAKLETWITRIMINTAIDHFRRSIRFKPLAEAKQRDEYYEIEYDDEQAISMEQLRKVIGMLPDGYRIIFNLYAIEGYTHKEIAAELEISEGTSKSQLARARMALQKLVKEHLNLG